jgi:3-hydroxyisobutyrate dehydrogenase-like beta-hydroxyacid dehydrogenase
MDEQQDQLAFIGFGEAARAFATDWTGKRSGAMAAYDIKMDETSTRSAMLAACDALGVEPAEGPDGAMRRAAAVFCLVTADQALEAARAAAPHLRSGTLWLDGNSCAPQTKTAAAEVIGAAGGIYVDMAIMAPVHPLRTRVPLLLSGPDLASALEWLERLGMSARTVGDRVGEASAIKMIRSVMIKGFEALCAECFLAARRAGVEAAVLASLQASDPEVDWQRRGAYNLERMMMHGARRAAEMREVTATVANFGLPAAMSAATADWQDRVAALGLEPGPPDLVARADAILGRL